MIIEATLLKLQELLRSTQSKASSVDNYSLSEANEILKHYFHDLISTLKKL